MCVRQFEVGSWLVDLHTRIIAPCLRALNPGRFIRSERAGIQLTGLKNHSPIRSWKYENVPSYQPLPTGNAVSKKHRRRWNRIGCSVPQNHRMFANCQTRKGSPTPRQQRTPGLVRQPKGQTPTMPKRKTRPRSTARRRLLSSTNQCFSFLPPNYFYEKNNGRLP